jgi:protein-disulfide isomerase
MASENLSAKEARKAAQAARAEAQAAEKQRERKVRIIGGSVVALVMIALIAIPLVNGRGKIAGIKNSAEIPAGVSRETYGLRVGPGWDAPNADSIPILQIWEDFQCPACKDLEVASGATIIDLALESKVRLEWRAALFLDDMLVDKNSAAGNPNSSLRATMAQGCAADAGRGLEYHRAVFERQPETEGDGFSTETLLDAARSVGITGDKLADFTTCLTNEKYKDWATNNGALFSREGNTGTPTGYLNGKELPQSPQNVLMIPTELKKAVADATKP